MQRQLVSRQRRLHDPHPDDHDHDVMLPFTEWHAPIQEATLRFQITSVKVPQSLLHPLPQPPAFGRIPLTHPTSKFPELHCASCTPVQACLSVLQAPQEAHHLAAPAGQ